RSTADLSLSIGGGANDGAAGESDEIGPGIEELRGGSGADRIIGDAGPNRLNAGAGDDQITGGDGDDVLVGEAGDDNLDARDGPGFTDTLVCGAGIDAALTDPPDRAG